MYQIESGRSVAIPGTDELPSSSQANKEENEYLCTIEAPVLF